MAKTKVHIDNFDAKLLRDYAERWNEADEEIIRVRDEIARVERETREKVWALQFKLGKLENERRFAELDMVRLIAERVHRDN